MNEADVLRCKRVLADHLPASAVERIFAYVVKHGVRLCFVPDRKTKLGFYKCPQRGHDFHEISLNGGMNASLSLFVLLHEMAHLECFLLHHNSVQPHGHEWQGLYGGLLTDYVAHFPDELQPLLQQYAARVPLSRSLGDEIQKRLFALDADGDAEQGLSLSDLPIGSEFVLASRPDLLLRSVEKRRTRYKCQDVHSGHLYLVAGVAPVRPKEDYFCHSREKL